jgi:peptidoglycan/xylan/chitin deacetylase (PgdA/CDA1 family)
MANRGPRFAIVLAVAASLIIVAPVAGAAARPPAEWVIGPRRVAMIVFDGHTGGSRFRVVLKALDTLNVKASFFVSGQWAREYKKVARRIVRDGHLLGNRGDGRRSFTTLNEKKLRTSIRRATRTLRRLGARPRPFLRGSAGRTRRQGSADRRRHGIPIGAMDAPPRRWTDPKGCQSGAGAPSSRLDRLAGYLEKIASQGTTQDRVGHTG